MLEVEVMRVIQPGERELPWVLLRHDTRVLPIVIGILEATAIQIALVGEKMIRPMTHDLACNLLAGLRGKLTSVSIYTLKDSTFFAHLNIEQVNGEGQVDQVLRIDSRPSDAIAIALRTGSPIFVAEEVMDDAGRELTVFGLEEGDDDDEGEEETYPEDD